MVDWLALMASAVVRLDARELKMPNLPKGMRFVFALTAVGMSAWFDPARAAQLGVVAPTKSCSDVKALDLSRGAIEPARIDTAETVTEGERQFCVVKGYVAPAVNFVVRLPTSGWTQRYLQLGCGGYCGGAR